MRVLFLMFVFPNMDKSFNMYTTISKQFALEGNQVTVVAPGQHGQATGIYIENGVEVLRVKTLPIKNVSNWRKGISNLLLPYQYKRALKEFYRVSSFDLIILPTPPITLADLAAKLKKRFSAKVYLILRDIFPQNAVDLGFMKHDSIIHKYFRSKERKLYRVADYIGCMSQGNIDYVLMHNSELSATKFHILRNFQYRYEEFGFDKIALREKYGLQNKFVMLFGGNMGKAQELDNVLELARRAMKYSDAIILLLGEGVMMERTAKRIEELGITNIKIQGSIPKQEYQDLLSVCDVGIISLHRNFTIPNIPSKSLDYWNVGLPILASVDRATDYNIILEHTNTGLWSYAGEHENFFKNFEKLYKDSELRKYFAANGRKYQQNYLMPKQAYETIIGNITSSKYHKHGDKTLS